jgi:membrane protein
MQYSAVLLLGPALLALALGLTSSQHLAWAKELMMRFPMLSHLLFKTTPVALLCLTFTIFYVVMPNTRVQWSAALVGGFVGGILWHLNNYFSVLYVSRWVTNNKIYGSLAIIPVFMAGLYISWWILLFGAQVAYAFQNRAAYLQEKQTETINQRGREFVALRLMEFIGMRFHRAETPATISEMADRLAVPSRLVQQIIQNLLSSRLVLEIAGLEFAYAPARPLEQITCHDILLSMRVGVGQEIETRDEPARLEVFGEFEKIMEAERRAASLVTLRTMVERTEHLAATAGKPVRKLG